MRKDFYVEDQSDGWGRTEGELLLSGWVPHRSYQVEVILSLYNVIYAYNILSLYPNYIRL